jgi:hypothetical protein
MSVDAPVHQHYFRAAKFADDLTAYNNFENATKNDEICKRLRDLQESVHEWGTQERVIFDAAKEHFCILHRSDPHGDVFKLLGTMIDPKLVMEDEANRIRKKARPKVNAFLGVTSDYDVKSMMEQFRYHVFCLLEGSS